VIERDRRDDDNHAGVFTLFRIQTQIADPACDQQPDVTVAQMILPNRLEQSLGHLLPRHRNLEANRTRRVPKPLQVFFEPKNPAVVKPYALKNSVSVEQTMIEDGNFRVCLRVEFSVDVNFCFPDAGRWSLPAFYCRFNCFLDRTLVSLWFVQHRRISGFHNSKEISNVWTRNSSRKNKRRYITTPLKR
jgi:hypothetical protein